MTVWGRKPPMRRLEDKKMNALISGVLPYMFRCFLIKVQCAGKLK